MKNVFYDTECFNDLFIASFLVEDEFIDFIFHKEIDKNKKEEFAAFYGRHNRESMFIGFNTLAYDNLMITRFLSVPDITLSDLKKYNDEIINAPKEEKKKPVFTKNFVDVFLALGGKGGLKPTAARMGLQNIIESNIDFDKKELTEEEVDNTLKYCHNDILLTKEIFISPECTDAINVRTLIPTKFPIPLKNAMRWSVGSISDFCIKSLMPDKIVIKKATRKYKGSDILYKELEYKTEVCREVRNKIAEWELGPDSDGKHEIKVEMGRGELKFGVGGLHYNTRDPFVFSGDENKYILDVDINSHYPTMIVNNNLGPEGIEKEYSGALKEVMKLRAEAKTKGESDVYKLVANTATGKLKYEYSDFFSPKTNEAMTVNGQLIILELVEELHLTGFIFAQVNTDGLSVFMEKSRRLIFDEILNRWSKKWSFGMKSSEYVRSIQRDVNNYLAISKEGKIKNIGFFKCYPDKTSPNNYPIVVKCVVDNLLNGTAVKETVKTGRPIDYTRYAKRNVWQIDGIDGFNIKGINRFYIAKGVDNKISGYFADEIKGERVVTNENNVLSANNLEDIDVNKIDYNVYIEKAEKILSKYKLDGLPSYQEVFRISIPKEKKSKNKGKSGKKTIREVITKANMLENGTDRLAICPVCGGERRAVLYNEGTEDELIKCFGCDAVLHLNDLLGEDEEEKNMEMPPKAQKCPITKEKEIKEEVYHKHTDPLSRDHLNINDLPDCVWAGSIGAIAEAVGEKSWKVLNGAISSRQAIIGKKISAKYRKGFIYGNTYTMTTGHSGSGKSLVTDIVHYTLGKKHKILSGVESGQALMHAVSRSEEVETGNTVMNKKGKSEKETVTIYHPTPVVLVFEEFMASLKKSGYEGSTLDQELCALFQASKPYTSCSQRNLKEQGIAIISVDNPEVSIVGTLITEQFRAHFNKDRQMSGFLNRFIVFPEDKTVWQQFDESDFDKDKLEHVFDEMRERKEMIIGNAGKSDFFTPAALAVYDRLFNSLFKVIGEGGDSNETPYIRLQTYFHILALGYAYDAGRYDRIEEEDALAAEAIVWASRKALLKLLDPAEAPVNIPAFMQYQNSLEQKIIGYVKSHDGTTKRGICTSLQRHGRYSEIGKTVEEMANNGLLKCEQKKQDFEGGQMVTIYHYTIV